MSALTVGLRSNPTGTTVSRGRKLFLTALRGYLAIAMVMVIVKVVMIAAH